jgi:hypothetical protein
MSPKRGSTPRLTDRFLDSKQIRQLVTRADIDPMNLLIALATDAVKQCLVFHTKYSLLTRRHSQSRSAARLDNIFSLLKHNIM